MLSTSSLLTSLLRPSPSVFRTAMDHEDVAAIMAYLTHGVYPKGLTRDDKRSLRQKSLSFICRDGQLFHRGKEGRQQLVIWDVGERQRIIHATHVDSASSRAGQHNGMNFTIRKIGEQYWWRRLVEDVRSFCKSCPGCGHLSAAGRLNDLNLEADDFYSR